MPTFRRTLVELSISKEHDYNDLNLCTSYGNAKVIYNLYTLRRINCYKSYRGNKDGWIDARYKKSTLG